jgi:TrmH family RNA methyltransferase
VIEIISGMHNQMIKFAKALRYKKGREESGCFSVEGIRLAEEAAQSGWEILFCIFTEEAQRQARIQNMLKILESRSCRLVKASSSVYAKITDTEQPQEIMLIMKKTVYALDNLLNRNSTPFLVILDQVQDPGNIGTIIRTADAAGCTGVLMTKGCADLFGGKTVRSTMGSLFHLPIIQGLSPQEIQSFLREKKVTLFTTSLSGARLYYHTDLSGSVALAFGNEGSGVSEEMLACSQHCLYIPIIGKSESLNVSASAAVILYETVRQRSLFACNHYSDML